MKHLYLFVRTQFTNSLRQRAAVHVLAKDEMCTDQHAYKTLYPWKSKGEFVRELVGNIFYNQEGLIALSKPYGVPATFPKEAKNRGMVKRQLYASGLGDAPFSLEDACNDLAIHLNVDHVIVMRSPERYASGVTILVSNELAARKVHKALLRAKPMKIPHITAWVIAKGYPLQSSAKEKVAMKLVPVGGDEKRVEVLREFSNNAVKGRLVKTVFAEFETLCKDTGTATSLLQVATSNVHQHFVRAYVASLASCVLGDWGASNCTDLAGRPIVLSPTAAAAARPQVLAAAVCQRLGISPTQQRMVPTMVHYRSLLLPHYHAGGQPLLLADPGLPRHFSWTLDRLQLWPPRQGQEPNKGSTA